jgi:SAM-dependent methyltransferase
MFLGHHGVLLRSLVVCNPACLGFVRRQVHKHDVKGRTVLEVGAREVNGSVRPYITSLDPSQYVGVDVAPGRGVDEVCDVADLVAHFGDDSFDVVITTEMVEHVEDWRRAFGQMKAVLRPHGLLLVTTRSPGFPRHGYPSDYWRFTPAHMRLIVRDFVDVEIEDDLSGPGVFLLARKPRGWIPADLSSVSVSAAPPRRALDLARAATARASYASSAAKSWLSLRRDHSK